MTEDWRVARVEEIRSLIKEAEPDLVEEIKWRKPLNPHWVPALSFDGLKCTLGMYKGKAKVKFAKGFVHQRPGQPFQREFEKSINEAVKANRTNRASKGRK